MAFGHTFLPTDPILVPSAGFSESPPPSVFRKPYSVVNQQFQTFEPDDVPTANGVASVESQVRVRRQRLIQNQFYTLSPIAAAPVVVTYQAWPQVSDLFRKVGLTFEAEGMAPTPPARSPQGWYGQSPNLFRKAGLTFEAEGMAPTVPAGSPQGWYGQALDLFRKPFLIPDDWSFIGQTTTPVVVTYQTWPQATDLFTKFIRLGQAEFRAPSSSPSPFSVAASNETVTVRGDFPIQTDFNVLQPITVAVVVTYQAWVQAPDVFSKPIRLGQSVFSAPVQSSRTTTVLAQAPELFRKSSRFDQSVFSAPVQSSRTTTVLAQAPELFRKSFFIPEDWSFVGQTTTPVVITYQAWSQTPDVFSKPIRLGQAEFVLPYPVFQPALSLAAFNDTTWVKRDFPIQTGFFVPSNQTPPPETPQGWMFQSPATFTPRSSPAIVTMFSGYVPNIVVSLTPSGRFPYSYISSSYIQ